MSQQVRITHFESTRHQLCIKQTSGGKMALVDMSTGDCAVISKDMGNRIALLAMEQATSIPNKGVRI